MGMDDRVVTECSSKVAKKDKAKNDTTNKRTLTKAGEGGYICVNCTEVQPSMKQCARCKLVHYCSRPCQLQHWSLHKSACHQRQSDTSCARVDGTQQQKANASNTKNEVAFVTCTLYGEECSICLEPVTGASNFQLPCGHWYHTRCLKGLREHGGSDNCPNCREPLPANPADARNCAIRLIVRAEQTRRVDME